MGAVQAQAAASFKVSPKAVAQLVAAVRTQAATTDVRSISHEARTLRQTATNLVRGLNLAPQDGLRQANSELRLQLRPKGPGAIVRVKYQF